MAILTSGVVPVLAPASTALALYPGSSIIPETAGMLAALRQTAMGYCDIIRKSEARPGDLIFFQGTYNTSGASHVGIYVGGGMMIHCGNPISYASIETSYWQQHYYCMGRIR